MKFNGDVLTVCPKEQVKNILLTDGATVAKIRDKSGFESTFQIKNDKWTVVLIRQLNIKRRLHDGRKRKGVNKPCLIS